MKNVSVILFILILFIFSSCNKEKPVITAVIKTGGALTTEEVMALQWDQICLDRLSTMKSIDEILFMYHIMADDNSKAQKEAKEILKKKIVEEIGRATTIDEMTYLKQALLSVSMASTESESEFKEILLFFKGRMAEMTIKELEYVTTSSEAYYLYYNGSEDSLIENRVLAKLDELESQNK